MTEIPAFGKWSEAVHRTEKQKRAIEKAVRSETTPVSVDREEESGVFWGSGKDLYQTTLSSCTCSEFVNFKVPCKHIYRLAMELGIIDREYKTGTSKGERLERQISLEDAISVLEGLSPDAFQRALEMLAVLKEERHNPHLVTEPDIIREFRACPLMVENPFPTEETLWLYERGELLDIAAKAGVEYSGRKNIAKEKLIRWMMENIRNLEKYLPAYASFSYIVNFDIAQYRLLKQVEGVRLAFLFRNFRDEEADKSKTEDADLLPTELRKLDGLVFTINGRQTDFPVVWFSGNTEEHAGAIRAAGGRWSEKRRAWYLKIRK